MVSFSGLVNALPIAALTGKKEGFHGALHLSYIGDFKITSTSTERQKRSQNLAPALVIIFGNSLVGKLLPVLVFTGDAPSARRHQ